MIAVCCVPIMLFVKPILLYFKHQNDPKPKPELKRPLLEKKEEPIKETSDQLLEHKEGEIEEKKEKTEFVFEIPAPSHSHGHEEFDISEIFVHQCIETIEFVLGSFRNLKF